MKHARSAAVVLMAVLVVMLPGVAHADIRTHSDPAGDVQYYLNSDPSNIPPPVAAPTRTHGDITVVRITNGTSTVRVVVYFRSLPRAGQFHGHVFRFVTGTFERKLQIAAGPEAPRGWTGKSDMFTTSGNRVACGMTHLLDYSHRRLILNVPRSCLNHPAFIKVGVGTIMLANDRTYFDDGFLTGGTMGVQAPRPTWRPTLGPTVAR